MEEKIKELAELKEIVARLRQQKKRIVFTNGCFDLIHVGHVRSLAKAKALGDVLIVGVNSDSSVRQLKGEKRPIMSQDERVELLSYLEMIDYLVIFNETTSSCLLRELKPDVYVKGGDYTLSTLPEWSVVKDYGGEVELVPVVNGCSTSEIIKKIKGL
ncbi:MAG: D-glycero-beta-D-manno-heptose 1-phosphate adenylyltransferase [Halanaerobiales bacterium]|nr:D-glycero-beta-D-manno-heptose 1-phosphate adenylyltransferase [Halanaerobiales bacterium]